MFSFFRRKKPPPPPATFNERIDAFWRWFTEVAPRFHQTIDAGNCANLTEETINAVSALSSGLAWVYGPGENGHGHSLTVSGEGVIHRQLLTLQWLQRAPQIDGWTFYAARQPGPIAGRVIELDGQRFDPKAIWVSLQPDLENQVIDITIWHPAWNEIEASQRNTVTFLFLDEALGEYGTDWRIGRIEHSQDKLADAIPMEEIAETVAALAAEHGWKKQVPGETWTLFTVKEAQSGFPRADIQTQNTCVPALFRDYLDARGELKDPLAGSGADYVYVAADRTILPPGEEVSRRGEIEDAIQRELDRFGGGRTIGGALGTEFVYIDLLIFEGDRSLQAIKEGLKQEGVFSGAMIEYFAQEKRGQRIAL